MKAIKVSEQSLARVLKYLNERKELLAAMKGEGHVVDLIKVEISTIETTLLLLDIKLD